MKRFKFIALFLLIFSFPLSSFGAENTGDALAEARAEFHNIENRFIADDLDSARSYFTDSDKGYSDIVAKLSSLGIEKLPAKDKCDCLFMLLTISLRKPELLSFDKIKPDYVNAIKGNLKEEGINKLFFDHIIYLYEAKFSPAAVSIIEELKKGGGFSGIYLDAGKYAIEKGKPNTAYSLFIPYLAGVYKDKGFKECSAESEKLEQLLKDKNSASLAERLELMRLKIALEASDNPSDIIRIINEKASTLYRQGSYSEALEMYELISWRVNDNKVLLTIGNIYYDLGKYELALQRYRDLPGAAEDPEVIFKMALCNRMLGENFAAYSLFKKIESDHKDSGFYDGALYYMGLLNREAGLLDESQRLFERLKSEKPGSEYNAMVENLKKNDVDPKDNTK